MGSGTTDGNLLVIATPNEQNPFLEGSLFVGRHLVMARLRNLIHHGQSLILIGGRRTGKTTLIRQLAAATVERKIIATDVAGWDLSSQASGLGALRSAIEGVPETRYPSGTRDDVVNGLNRLTDCALFIDEADRLLQADWGSSFFSFLRWMDDTCYRTRMSIVLVGGPVLAQFRDPDDRGSPPLNYAHLEFLEPLDLLAITELSSSLSRPMDSAVLLLWTGGNAWLATQLLSLMWQGSDFATAAEAVHDRAAMQVFPIWEKQAGLQCLELLREMPKDGVEKGRLMGGDLARYRSSARSGRSVGVLRMEGDRFIPGPQPFLDWLRSSSTMPLTWDLAISFASEDTDVAREIYAQLRNRFQVFFAPQESAALWGIDLHRILPNTYGVRSRFILILSTDHYVKKYWTKLEFRSIAQTFPERILFMDMGGLPDEIPKGLVYRGTSQAELIGLISALEHKLGP